MRLTKSRSSYYFMTNILLVFTGGTIGSQVDNGTIDTRATAGFKLIHLFQQCHPAQARVRFKTLQPIQILSENLHPTFWQQVIAAIETEELADFDGIIVTHGTDTLAFTAAAFGVYFNHLKIPLLLVSSNLPLDNPEANGLKNFICAVDYILQKQEAGVFVPYQNPEQPMHVHIGTRLSSCLPLSGDFISVQSRAYLSYADGEFRQLHPLPPPEAPTHTLKNQFARILLLRPYPGMNYADYHLHGVDAVLHDLYHSGTACASRQWGPQHSLIDFSQRCREANIPLYLAPSLQSDAAYSSTRDILSHGAKMIWNTSLETAYAKLALAFAHFNDSQTINTFLEQDVAREKL